MVTKEKICVLGAGAWGTALGHHLRLRGYRVVLFDRDVEALREICTNQRNPRHLKTLTLGSGFEYREDAALAVEDAALVVYVLPSSACRQVSASIRKGLSPETLVISAAKGLEDKTLKRMSQVLAEEVGGDERVGALSGPSFAFEVGQGLPTAVTLAMSNIDNAKRAASYFHHGNFRIYTSTDLAGVEFGGALKNVIALAAGMVDGAGMGTNARAALLTRGLAEMQRIIVCAGGEERTTWGLSGLGDLILTATGDLSRNRQVGMRLGKGERLSDILESLGEVAEGVYTTEKAVELGRKLGVETPIMDEVYRVISGERSVRESVGALLSRAQRDE